MASDYIAVDGYETNEDYHDTQIIEITDRKIGKISNQTSTRAENNSQILTFQIERYPDGYDLLDTTIKIHYECKNSNGEMQGGDNAPINVLANNESVLFSWAIPAAATQIAQDIEFMAYAVANDYVYKTLPKSYSISDTLDVGGEIPKPDDGWYTDFVTQMEAQVSAAKAAKVDAQTAASAAETSAAGVETSAEAAKTAETNAKASAETAQTAAETAQTAAQTAADDATSAAETTLQGYVTAAETAKTGAETAQAAAETAQSKAEEAAAKSGGGNLVAQNVSVAAASWTASTTYDGYAYEASVPITDCTAEYIPEVMLSFMDVVGGNFAPVAESYAGGVKLYATKSPTVETVIPSVILTKAVN